MKQFQEFVEAGFARGDFDGVDALLAPDVVFRSPVAFKPYRGRPLVAAILRGVSRVFTDFRYVDTIEQGNHSALVFETTIGDVAVHGCDFIVTGDDGLITEFTVMVRPLSASNALAAAMAAEFGRIEAEVAAELSGGAA